MIDRVAALAGIVAPSPVARPPASLWWHGPLGWSLGVVALALALVATVACVRRLRRGLARRRLRRLAGRLRQAAPQHVDVAAVLPSVWADMRRAGIAAAGLRGQARALRQHLLYARVQPPAVLRAFLDALRP